MAPGCSAYPRESKYPTFKISGPKTIGFLGPEPLDIGYLDHLGIPGPQRPRQHEDHTFWFYAQDEGESRHHDLQDSSVYVTFLGPYVNRPRGFLLLCLKVPKCSNVLGIWGFCIRNQNHGFR